MSIKKRHQRGHGQAAVYITLPDGGTIRWENYKDVPLQELAAQLRTTADSVEKCAPIEVAEARLAAMTKQRDELLAACCAARSYCSDGTTDDGISVSYLLDEAIRKSKVQS